MADITKYDPVECRRCGGILANCVLDYSRKDRIKWNEKNKTCICGGSLI